MGRKAHEARACDAKPMSMRQASLTDHCATLGNGGCGGPFYRRQSMANFSEPSPHASPGSSASQGTTAYRPAIAELPSCLPQPLGYWIYAEVVMDRLALAYLPGFAIALGFITLSLAVIDQANAPHAPINAQPAPAPMAVDESNRAGLWITTEHEPGHEGLPPRHLRF
ncbi:hypothetical protein DNJ95_18210 [Stutzerimonas kirkiae]|uniref:Uncharacterized protein n=1 Tax=Stutzerimonas kirkiae TaxID=2211392 RepID=A0A4Q9R0D9_9GAMM|nr:hypothetical protein DNJ96_15665 [Stutzerimonas kirkiae]TBU98441.1 hypothetical protein DNJ95_18210 [Stutzerimonas kirkiae]